MDNATRRNFLKNFGLGTAALSVAGELGRTPQAAEANQASHSGQDQMPGRPPSGDSGTEAGARPANIMAIAAHPGDAFFAMGAPVALQTHLGGQGVLLSLSLGEKGSATIPPAQYGQMQREASEQAAQMLGARAMFLEYPDGEIPINDEVKFAVCDLIREHKPGVIVTHWRGSWHKDHQACYAIVNDAVFYAGLPAIVRKAPAHDVGKLFFGDNWEDATGFVADTYLDISAVSDRWIQACAVFPMWRGENGFRYNDYYTSLAVERGCLGGFRRAVALMSPAEQRTRRIGRL
jgi:LmbE family N-acetylglucosaminyl deacetylase